MAYMDFHILAILGTSGKDSKSIYNKDSALDLPLLKEGEFHNSTHCLIESFGQNATYTFIGTSESIADQNALFANLSHCKCKDIFATDNPQANIIEVPDSDIEAIFSHILESITSAKSDKIILDITHSFRHKSIIASFASTLGQINSQKSITLLFAKEIQRGQKYQYISLERYQDISLIAIALQTFVQTLAVPQIGIDTKTYPFIKTLTEFANALHANALSQIFIQLNKAKDELQKIKNGTRFRGLENILLEVETILDRFVAIDKLPTNYKKYYEISLFMNEMGYYLIAITYIREAIPLYELDKVKDFKKPNIKYYDKSKAVNDYLNGEALNPYIFENADYLDNKLKKQGFANLKAMTENIGKIRNDLAHINPKLRELKDIKLSLTNTLNDFKNKCLIQDCLKNL